MLGQLIEDRYLVEQELGEGAMGRVYRARHVKVGRQVAIKVMHRELARVPSVVERFAREARIAARLNHPNLIGVVDVGMTPDRLPLIVLELAPGKSMFQILNGPMPRERVVRMVRQLLLGLDHAHAAGLVHRDLKPDNILVETQADGTEIPRIVDFGIAVCNAQDDAIANRRLTEVNTVIGTPSYMSPEQAMAKPLDARTDLFSMGIIMYEMLAGVVPFDGTGVDVAVLAASKDAPTIAERAGVLVDPLLEAFVRKLIARKADERFQSAREALIMLDKIEADRIDAARALSAPAESLAVVDLPSPHIRFDNTDRLRTRRVTAVTRVEMMPVSRRSRRRGIAAVALAAAAFTAFVGWSFREPPIATAASITSQVEGHIELPIASAVTATETAPAIAAAELAAPAPSVKKPMVMVAPKAAPTAAVPPAAVAPAVAAPAPAAPEAAADSGSLAARYVEVGRQLRGASDELWARYRLIRINDALKSESSRRTALVALGEIERAIQH